MGDKFSPEFLDFVNNRCLVKNPAKRADCFELLCHDLFTKLYPDQDELFDSYLMHLTNYMNTPKFKSKL
jgi:serine/threonine protein kinase